MSPEERSLAIFPLNTVLFPDVALPLQIFEERYKIMLQDCLDSDSRLGIVLIKAGTEVGEPAIPHSVGTIAHIIQVNEIRGGRFFISALGRQRFRIKNITQYRPYMTAQVELLTDQENAALPENRQDEIKRTVAKYESLVAGLQGGWSRDTKISSDPTTLSYHIAGLLQANLPEKQALLEENSAHQRLEKAIELLEQDMATLKQQVVRELRRKFSKQ